MPKLEKEYTEEVTARISKELYDKTKPFRKTKTLSILIRGLLNGWFSKENVLGLDSDGKLLLKLAHYPVLKKMFK